MNPKKQKAIDTALKKYGANYAKQAAAKDKAIADAKKKYGK